MRSSQGPQVSWLGLCWAGMIAWLSGFQPAPAGGLLSLLLWKLLQSLPESVPCSTVQQWSSLMLEPRGHTAHPSSAAALYDIKRPRALVSSPCEKEVRVPWNHWYCKCFETAYVTAEWGLADHSFSLRYLFLLASKTLHFLQGTGSPHLLHLVGFSWGFRVKLWYRAWHGASAQQMSAWNQDDTARTGQII